MTPFATEVTVKNNYGLPVGNIEFKVELWLRGRKWSEGSDIAVIVMSSTPSADLAQFVPIITGFSVTPDGRIEIVDKDTAFSGPGTPVENALGRFMAAADRINALEGVDSITPEQRTALRSDFMDAMHQV